MKSKSYSNQDGSTLICALCTILIMSLIGANVLLNCTIRYNVSSKQIKGWKEALYAAEGGADIAFSEVRKLVNSPSTAFLHSGGWTTTAGPSYSNGPYSFGQNNSLSANVTVDQLTATLSGQPQFYYRIRSQGTATLLGLPRVGMDDRMGSVIRGDSLLRKIDFKYDHFKAAYGDGDGNGKAIQAVANPQITRRIETIAVPQFASFTSGLEVGNSFAGPGHAGLIDSYNSKNGGYPGTSIAQNPVPPTDPNYNYYIYSRQANVSVGTGSFTDWGPIYGNVSTNGGNVTHASANISGTIDNSAPFTLPPLVIPNTGVATGFATGSGTTLDLSTAPAGTGTAPLAPAKYVYSSLSSGLTIPGLLGTDKTLPSYNKPIETYVTIVVGSAGSQTGDIGGITLGAGVNAKIYFTGNLNVNASALVNNNRDGAAGVYNADGSASSGYSAAGHLQFYGISPPTGGSPQSVAITPGGGSNKDVYATIYAPGADISVTGNVNWYGAIVASSFSGNGDGGGNTSFHYDTQIAGDGVLTDYQIASYIEDIR
ncbi:MAG TPA: hypothetical protein VNY07_02195 [Chthoniobacterales bacterium]|nr:hypothetical protein [Chthoniobacterales bacterium]